jgi:hypothetical protein
MCQQQHGGLQQIQLVWAAWTATQAGAAAAAVSRPTVPFKNCRRLGQFSLQHAGVELTSFFWAWQQLSLLGFVLGWWRDCHQLLQLCQQGRTALQQQLMLLGAATRSTQAHSSSSSSSK